MGISLIEGVLIGIGTVLVIGITVIIVQLQTMAVNLGEGIKLLRTSERHNTWVQGEIMVKRLNDIARDMEKQKRVTEWHLPKIREELTAVRYEIDHTRWEISHGRKGVTLDTQV